MATKREDSFNLNKNKPYKEVLGAAQLTKHTKACKCVEMYVNACKRM